MQSVHEKEVKMTTLDKLNRLKELLAPEKEGILLISLLNDVEARCYEKGFLDGIEAFAHWQDGEQLVGTCGKTLEKARAEVKQTWNYDPNVPWSME